MRSRDDLSRPADASTTPRRGTRCRRYWKGHYLRELPDEAIEAFLCAAPPTATAACPGRSRPTAARSPTSPTTTTAFSHRDAAFEFVAAPRWTDPAEDAARMAARAAPAAAMEPFASGVYVNALSDEGAAGVRRAYPAAKLARLTALKDRYDPDNVSISTRTSRPRARRAGRCRATARSRGPSGPACRAG